jgi:hypothetical protein
MAVTTSISPTGNTTARVGFPGRVTTGVCMIAAPILLAALCLLGSGVYKFDGRAFLTAMAAHPAITTTFLNAVPIAVFLLMLAAIGLAGAARAASPRLSDIGGALALLGLCGPIFFIATEFCGYQLSSPAHLAAGAYMYDQANMVPRISLNISGAAIVAGFILLAVAANRAGLLGRTRAVCLACTALLPFGFISAILPISAAGFIGCSIALVPLGLSWLRTRTDAVSPSAERPVHDRTDVSGTTL